MMYGRRCTSVAALLVLIVASVVAQDDGGRGIELGTVPYQFTLAALNTTLPNANNTGAPLVLGAGGATGGVTVYSTSTWNTFPYSAPRTFALTNYALRAFHDGDGTSRINATSVIAGQQLTWIASTRYPALAEKNAVYSIVGAPRHGAVGHPSSTSGGSDPTNTGNEGIGQGLRLAAYNITDLWSLCPDKYPNAPQTRLVFNVSAVRDSPPDWLTFDPQQCYSVAVNVLPTGLLS